MNKKERAKEIFLRLAKRYPAPEPALDWTNAWELMVSTILAAQCTDERVNKVTPELFRRWPDIPSMAAANVEEVQEVVRSTGFFRNKGKNIVASANLAMDAFGGEIPRTMAELTKMPGVARKTANIVLSNAFGVHEGIAVDTHVKRLTFRMGLTTNTDPVRIEKDLMPLFKQDQWNDINHFLVYFGREVCPARKPQCEICELDDICPKKGVK